MAEICKKCNGSGVKTGEGFHYTICECKDKKSKKKKDALLKVENEEVIKLRELLKIEQEINKNIEEELKSIKSTKHCHYVPITSLIEEKEELEVVPDRPIKPRRGCKPKNG